MKKFNFILFALMSLFLLVACPPTNSTDPNSNSMDPNSNSGNGGGSSPDLTVDSITVNDSTRSTDQSITLSTTVSNSGSASSAATTLRWYLSVDATISSSDTEVGTDTVSIISAGGSESENITISVPSTAGIYYYGACVNVVSGESSTANNCSSGTRVVVSSSDGGGNTATINLINTSSFDVDMALGQFDGTSTFLREYGCSNVSANNCTHTISNGSYDVGVREYTTNGPTAWLITRENFQYQSGRTYDIKYVLRGSQVWDFRIDIVSR